jgi:hypothetical protein
MRLTMRGTTGFHPFALRPENGERTTFEHYCIHGNMVEITSPSLTRRHLPAQ